MVQVYPAVFHPNEDGSITVSFPDLECDTEGKNLADAIHMARDCLAIYLDTADMVGQEVLPPSPRESVRIDAGEYITLIDADPDIYKRKRNSQAVKRTISLPAWMDEMASEAGLSLSKVTQDALSERLSVRE